MECTNSWRCVRQIRPTHPQQMILMAFQQPPERQPNNDNQHPPIRYDDFVGRQELKILGVWLPHTILEYIDKMRKKQTRHILLMTDIDYTTWQEQRTNNYHVSTYLVFVKKVKIKYDYLLLTRQHYCLLVYCNILMQQKVYRRWS